VCGVYFLSGFCGIGIFVEHFSVFCQQINGATVHIILLYAEAVLKSGS
jgi:hypothetical protein